MAHIVVIVGLPGSGKSTLAQSFGLPVIEDFYTKEKDTPDADCVIDGVLLVEERFQIKLQQALNDQGHSSEWIFFENNPKQCMINISLPSRDKKVLRSTVDHFSKRYHIPTGSRVIPVYTK